MKFGSFCRKWHENLKSDRIGEVQTKKGKHDILSCIQNSELETTTRFRCKTVEVEMKFQLGNLLNKWKEDKGWRPTELVSKVSKYNLRLAKKYMSSSD